MLNREMPSNRDAEAGLIGSLLMESNETLLSDCQAMGITKNSFTNPQAQVMFEAIRLMADDNRKPDAVELMAQLQKMEQLDLAGGATGISYFMGLCETVSQAKRWAEIVKESEVRRYLIRICLTVEEQAYGWEHELSKTVAYLDEKVANVGKVMTGDKTLSLAQVSKKYEDIIKMLANGQAMPKGILSGFPTLDEMTRGLRKKTMTILAARPSVGKTSLVTNMIYNIISKNPKARVLFFTLEMDDWSIYEKMLCGAAGVSSNQLRDGWTTPAQREEMLKCCKELDASDAFVNDSSDLNSSKIRAIARQMNARKPIDLVVVDYLQFVKAADGTSTREQQVSEISRSMKSMSKELDCPVIILSQLSRDSEKNDRRPRLSDLRDSGAIEQDADVVEMLWNNREQQYIELIVAKNRVGATGMVKLHFNAPTTKFTELSPYAEPALKSAGGEE